MQHESVEQIVKDFSPAVADPLVALARRLRKAWALLEKKGVTHSDHFLCTLKRALRVAINQEDEIILGACALTHDLCPEKRLVSSDATDELARWAFRWLHMTDGAARAVKAIRRTKNDTLLERIGTITVINSLHDAGSARFFVEFKAKELQRRLVMFHSIDTLSMIAWPAGGLQNGVIDGPLHSLWQKHKNGDAARQVVIKNAESVKERQAALLGLSPPPAQLIDCFKGPAKELLLEYVEKWREHGVDLV